MASRKPPKSAPSKKPAARKGKKLPPRQERFAQEYVKDLRAGPAAVRAGYSPESAETNGPRLLRNAQVAQAVAEKQRTAAEIAGVDAVSVLVELKRLAMLDLAGAYDEKGHLLPVHEMPEDVRRAIASIKVFDEYDGTGRDRFKVGEVREVRFHDKRGSLELLGKHLVLFKDQLDVNLKGLVDTRSVTPEEWEALAQLRHKVRAQRTETP